MSSIFILFFNFVLEEKEVHFRNKPEMNYNIHIPFFCKDFISLFVAAFHLESTKVFYTLLRINIIDN